MYVPTATISKIYLLF